MRSTVNVIWLEDKTTGNNKRPHTGRVNAVKNHINSKGYYANIQVVETFEEAEAKLSTRGGEERYDFFISDFDLGGGAQSKKGLDYLIEVRKDKHNFKRFFVLYSRNEYSTISERVTNKLKEEENINLFTNFSFISITSDDTYTIDDIEQKFKECIDVGLARWDELNALRGIYISEHAEIEMKLDRMNIYGSYEEKINYFCQDRGLSKELIDTWEEQRKLRNAFAHVTEAFDNRPGKQCYFIQSQFDKSVTIYENDLDEYRKKIIDFKNQINELL